MAAARTWLTKARPVRRSRRAGWIAAYAGCVFGPVLLMVSSTPAGTSALTASADALGLMGLAMLGLQLLLPARWGPLTKTFGTDALVRAHRPLAAVGSLFVALHLILLMVDDPSRLSLLEFWSAPTRARLAVLATLALTALIGTSVMRARLRLKYETWRRLHLVLGVILVVGGTAHALLVGHYLAAGPLRVVALALLGVSLAGVLFLRIGRPLLVSHRYLVESVTEEEGGVLTLQLSADGHGGAPFAPGQFAWLKPSGQPLALVEHPFSFASSAHQPDRPTFTVRPVGDFTASTVRSLAGSRVLLDSPHGGWRPTHPERGLVLLASGIGITPAMSVLRTFADEPAAPPVTLVYASRDPDAVVFARELDELSRRLPLEIVHLPGADPHRRRHLDAALLLDVLGAGARRRDFLVCGSPRFTAAALAATARIGIPRVQVHAEAF